MHVTNAMVNRPEYPPPSGGATSPLMLEGWLVFNETRWGLTSRRIRLSACEPDGPAIEAVYSLNAAGKIMLPPLIPYLPVKFDPAPEDTHTPIGQQWDTAGDLLARSMRERGLRHVVPLPPCMPDIRPWQRARFVADVKYTYHVGLPYDESGMRTNIRRSISNSRKAGFVCERTENLAHLHECLLQTEERQGFSHGFTLSDLRLAQLLLGHEAFRVYVCYAPDGTPASATIELHQPGATALGWMAGTKTEYLRSGVAQHLQRYVLDDLCAAGAVGYDFVGAQLPTIAAMKAAWGATLIPYYRVDGGRVRTLARHARDYWSFRRAAS